MYPRFLQFGALVISTYGMLALIAAFCGIALWSSLARRLDINAAKIQNAGLIAVVSVVAGARLAVIFANWRGFLEAPLLVLMAGTLSTGSAALYGVLLAAIVTSLSLLRMRIPLLPVYSAAAPAVALSLAILDVGDLAAGTHYGAPTTAPWGVTYSDRFAARTAGVPLGMALHPVQLYAALGHFAIAAALILLLRHGHRPAEVIGAALCAEGALRFLFAPFSAGNADAALFLHAMTVPQALAMAMVAIGGLCWLRHPHPAAIRHV